MSFEAFQAIGLSVLPGGFWLWYVYGLARRGRSTLPAMAVVFGIGVFSPAAVIASSELLGVGSPPAGALDSLLYFILAVGLVEEFWKMAVVRLTVYYHRSFREPADGLLYSACSALGFATAENTHYILSFGEPGLILGRAILSTFGHVLMSSFWGYALGRQKEKGGRSLLSLKGLALAALAHGLYDWLLIQEIPLAAVAVIGAMGWLFRDRMRESVHLSASRRLTSRRARECPACRKIVRAEVGFCTHCGRSLESPERVFCRNCLAGAEGEERCGGCGATFLPPIAGSAPG